MNKKNEPSKGINKISWPQKIGMVILIIASIVYIASSLYDYPYLEAISKLKYLTSKRYVDKVSYDGKGTVRITLNKKGLKKMRLTDERLHNSNNKGPHYKLSVDRGFQYHYDKIIKYPVLDYTAPSILDTLLGLFYSILPYLLSLLCLFALFYFGGLGAAMGLDMKDKTSTLWDKTKWKASKTNDNSVER